MNPPTMELVVTALGWTLIHFAWQATAWSLLAWSALRMIPTSKPGLRYTVACVLLLTMASSGPATFGYLCGRSPAPTDSRYVMADASDAAPAANTPPAGCPQLSSDSQPTITDLPAADSLAGTGVVTSERTESLRPTEATLGWPPIRSWIPWLVILWLAGVAVLVVRLVLGLFRIETWKREAIAPDPAFQNRVYAVADRLGVRRRLRIGLVESLNVPVVFGWFRPTVLIPSSLLTGMTLQELDSLLAHELAHVRRWDYLVNLAQNLIEILYFFHPGVWWLSGQVRRERENCCDDWAAATCGDPLVLARALTRLEELRQPSLALSAAQSPLKSRVLRLIKPGERESLTRLAFSSVVLLVASLLITGTFSAAVATGWGVPTNRENSGEHRIPYRVVRQDAGQIQQLEVSAIELVRNPHAWMSIWEAASEEWSSKPDQLTEYETLVSAQQFTRTMDRRLEAGQVTFNLPEGSQLKIAMKGEPIRITESKDGRTRFSLVEGRLELWDALGVVRAWAVPAHTTTETVLQVESWIQDQEVVLKLSVKPEAGTSDPSPPLVRVQVNPETGTEVPDSPLPHRAMRFEIDDTPQPFRFRARWHYQTDRLKSDATSETTHLPSAAVGDHETAPQSPERDQESQDAPDSMNLKVIDASGQPADRLRIYGKLRGGPRDPDRFIAATNEVGEVTIANPRQYTMLMMAGADQGMQILRTDQKAWQSHRLRRILERPTVTVRLLPFDPLVFRIVLPNGEPAAQGKLFFPILPTPRMLYLSPHGDASSWGLPMERFTHETATSIDDSGVAVVRCFPRWLAQHPSQTIGVQVPGFGTQYFPATQQELKLRPVGKLRLRIPPSEVPIGASRHGHARTNDATIRTGVRSTFGNSFARFRFDQQGVAEIPALAAGELRLMLEAWDGLLEPPSVPSDLKIQPGQTLEVDLRPTPSRHVQISVSDQSNGRPVPEVALELKVGQNRLSGPDFETDADGKWSGRLPAGDLELRILSLPDRFHRPSPIGFSLEAGKTQSLPLRWKLVPRETTLPDTPMQETSMQDTPAEDHPAEDTLTDEDPVDGPSPAPVPQPLHDDDQREWGPLAEQSQLRSHLSFVSSPSQFRVGQAIPVQLTVANFGQQPTQVNAGYYRIVIQNADGEILPYGPDSRRQLPDFQSEIAARTSLTVWQNRDASLGYELPPGKYRIWASGANWALGALARGSQVLEFEMLPNTSLAPNNPAASEPSPHRQDAPGPTTPTGQTKAAFPESRWTVTGTVTNLDGEPMPDVEVRAYTGVATLRRTGETHTNAQGKYVLKFGPALQSPEGVPLQAATISVIRKNYSEANLGRQGDLLMADQIPSDPSLAGQDSGRRLLLPDQPMKVDFVLIPAATVSGRLVDAEGEPLIKASVSLTGDQLPPSSSVIDQVITDDQGRFTVPEVPANYPFQWLIEMADDGQGRVAWASPRFSLHRDGNRWMTRLQDPETSVTLQADSFILRTGGPGNHWKKELQSAVDRSWEYDHRDTTLTIQLGTQPIPQPSRGKAASGNPEVPMDR